MRRLRRIPALAACALLTLGLAAVPARAEKADRDKPTQIEADRMSADDARRVSIFEGNVVFSKGTISLRADRVVVRQDADGYLQATASGKPVRFRQKSDPSGAQAGVWAEAEALRIEIDDRSQKVELFEHARVLRGEDEVRGEYIALDQRTQVFSASAAKGGGAEGRVRAVIQPRAPAGEPAPAPGPAGAEKPPAR